MAMGLEKEIAIALTSQDLLDRACREIDRLEKTGFSVLTIQDEHYPECLRETFDPPLVLYYAGKISTLSKPAISIVGARKPTPYGRAVAERLAHDLSAKGLVVVSGMARGIDSVAHWGALKGGETIAVLGSGLQRIYPKENEPLFGNIIENGLVLSEYAMKAPPLKYHFPNRNRIISGLSLGVVVVEGTKRSGSIMSYVLRSLAVIAATVVLVAVDTAQQPAQAQATVAFRGYPVGTVVVMMIVRPEGLWPSARRRMELHEHDEGPAQPGETPAGDWYRRRAGS